MAIDTSGFALPKTNAGKITLTPAQRARLLDELCEKQQMLCCTCHCRMTREMGFNCTATLGHDQPEPMGAKKRDNLDNILGAQCWKCNYKRGSKRK